MEPLLRPFATIITVTIGSIAVGACGSNTRRSAANGPSLGPLGGSVGASLTGGFVRLPDPYSRTPVASCGSTEADQTTATLNGVRLRAGLAAMTCLAPLSVAATAHAQYLAANDRDLQASRHDEVKGKAGFTGETLAARADAAGLDHAPFWLSEGIGGAGTPDEILATHLSTVYHRSPLLTPGGRYFSFAHFNGREAQVVMDSLSWLDVTGLSATVFPEDGAQNVPTAFGAARETPDPAPDLVSPGYPVSVHFPRYIALDDRMEPLLRVALFTLEDDASQLVSTRLIAPPSDAALSRADAFLMPENALEYDRDYVAHVRAQYGALTLDRRWRFHTAAPHTP